MMIILLISIILYLIEAHNHGITMPDFEVYYKSAVRLLQGENLYRIESDGFYVFKYAPASAIFFLPFTIIPFALAKYLYWVFLTLVAMAAVYIVFDLSKPGLAQRKVSKFTTYVLLLVLSMGLHLYREFILGQVNIVLFLSYILILILIQKDKPYLAGLFLAAGIMFKPWGIILLPWLLLRKDYRIVLSFLLFTTLLFLLPVIFYGWQGLLEQNGKWLQELILEMENKQELGAMSNLTIFSVLYRYTPMRFVELNETSSLLFQLGVLILMALAAWWFVHRGKNVQRKEVAEAALLIGMMPLIAPANYNTFLMIGLILGISFVHFRQAPIWTRILLIVGIILQGGNYNDVWGTDLSNYFLGLSLVTVGVMLIFPMLFVLRYRKLI